MSLRLSMDGGRAVPSVFYLAPHVIGLFQMPGVMSWSGRRKSAVRSS